jgi:RNA polymerase sigma-70 factor (ECF subfamily)
MAVRVDEIDGSAFGAVDLDRDRLLVLRHQGGERHAFDELYRRYHHRLVRYCQRRVGDEHVAEELAQEAFVRALRALPTFGGERRFYPWLAVIAGRLCIDHHRRNGRVEPSAEVDPGSVEADHEALWASVDHLHLAAAVERLAPRHREILELREQRGWSYQELAAHLDVPLTTVEALLHRARKALRREYAAVAGEDAGRLAAFGGLAALLLRSKAWLGALRAEQVAPAAAALAAIAGVAAIGASITPEPDLPPLDVPIVVTASSSDEPSAVPLAPGDPSVAAEATGPAGLPPVGATAPGPAAGERPAPAFEVGPVAVFADEAGQRYVDESVEAMPVVVDLGLMRLGVDPANLLGVTVEPDGSTAPPPPGAEG